MEKSTPVFRESFKCDVCDELFYKNDVFMEHFKAHNDPNCFISANCGVAFPAISSLKRYNEAHILKTYKCDQCEKTYTKRDLFQLHREEHFEAHMFKCSKCNQSFWTEESLGEHDILHRDVKLFKCDLCGVSFITDEALTQHSLVHADEKPTECDECGKICFRDELERHKIKHGATKPFEAILHEK